MINIIYIIQHLCLNTGDRESVYDTIRDDHLADSKRNHVDTGIPLILLISED